MSDKPTRVELTNLLVKIIDNVKEMEDTMIGDTIEGAEKIVGMVQSGSKEVNDQTIMNAIAIIGSLSHSLDAFAGVIDDLSQGKAITNPFDSLINKLSESKILANKGLDESTGSNITNKE